MKNEKLTFQTSPLCPFDVTLVIPYWRVGSVKKPQYNINNPQNGFARVRNCVHLRVFIRARKRGMSINLSVTNNNYIITDES